MKISIITPSFNQGRFIEKNIRSVMQQNWADVEHIIIDGGSSDNTVNILKKYKHLIWVSEPDGGQADALNKGLAMATGDIIGWINSDDYYEPNIFGEIVDHFTDCSDVRWLIGNVSFVYLNVGTVHKQSPTITLDNLLRDPDRLRQQGAFFKKDLISESGGWDKDLYMVMDYDLWIKMAGLSTPKMIDKTYAYFLWHEDQKTSSKNTLKQIKEISMLLNKNRVRKSIIVLMFIKKIIYLIKGVLKKIMIDLGIIEQKMSIIPFSDRKVIK